MLPMRGRCQYKENDYNSNYSRTFFPSYNKSRSSSVNTRPTSSCKDNNCRPPFLPYSPFPVYSNESTFRYDTNNIKYSNPSNNNYTRSNYNKDNIYSDISNDYNVYSTSPWRKNYLSTYNIY
ncbi:unnamed protein product [Heterobilharzia americana]|nr:unnamed protein product [Heterobilharzia americana]